MSGCCVPAREPQDSGAKAAPSVDTVVHRSADSGPARLQYARLPGGAFAMGDPFGEGYPNDGEQPVHDVHVDAFSIAVTAVTNAQFAAFVDATGYVTDAERFGSSAVFHLAVQARDEDIVGRITGVDWWIEVQGADWAHPYGRRSLWRELPRHPVVHISWFDASAFCAWAGARLPTEAEWEYAARGGHVGQRFPWGDELTPDGEHRCNIWQGVFPEENTLADGYLTTAPVRTFEPNDFGIYQTSGNVWEWCADWFATDYYSKSRHQNPPGPDHGTRRVMRGGSYLCHDSYCHRYRVAARSSNTPESSSGNLGFRVIQRRA